jgi:hypothetical protein
MTDLADADADVDENADADATTYTRSPVFHAVKAVMSSLPYRTVLRGRLLIEFVNVLGAIRDPGPGSVARRAWWRTLEQHFLFRLNLGATRTSGTKDALTDLAHMLLLKTRVVPSKVREVLGNAIISGYSAADFQQCEEDGVQTTGTPAPPTRLSAETLCLSARCVWDVDPMPLLPPMADHTRAATPPPSRRVKIDAGL